ncbi:MAG TPA: KilA-N domain-containing protein [Kamptonema sp.]|nr:KilA-N domain-containing protein [Kamptonema sp.]
MSKLMVSWFDQFPSFDGNTVEIRGKDGYFSATDMNRILGKRVAEWRKTSFAKRLLARLSEKSGMPIEQKLQTRGEQSSTPATALIQYDTDGDQKTWLHPYVAMSYAMSNPEFQAEINMWVVDLLTLGTVNPHILLWTQEEFQRGLKFNRDDINDMYSR